MSYVKPHPRLTTSPSSVITRGLKQQDHLQHQPGRAAMRAAQHTVAPAAARKDRHKSAGTEMFGALSAFRLMTPEEVVLGGSILNVLLAGLKAGAGAVTGSAALIADAGHSLSDLLSDAFALAAARVPRWERTCTQGIALMLLTTGATMMYTSGGALLTALRAPSLIITSGSTALDSVGLLIALLSIASKEALYHLTYVVGVRHKSSTLVANAHHHRSDALSSIAAACGICGTMVGLQLLDSLSALVVGGMVLKLGIETAC